MAFLDSDDAIHPLLFEEMLQQMEKYRVEMVFCNFIRVENRQMDAILAKASPQDERPKWQIGDGAESEQWFHIDHIDALSRVSGIVSRDLIGSLRFDEMFSSGAGKTSFPANSGGDMRFAKNWAEKTNVGGSKHWRSGNAGILCFNLQVCCINSCSIYASNAIHSTSRSAGP